MTEGVGGSPPVGAPLGAGALVGVLVLVLVEVGAGLEPGPDRLDVVGLEPVEEEEEEELEPVEEEELEVTTSQLTAPSWMYSPSPEVLRS